MTEEKNLYSLWMSLGSLTLGLVPSSKENLSRLATTDVKHKACVWTGSMELNSQLESAVIFPPLYLKPGLYLPLQPISQIDWPKWGFRSLKCFRWAELLCQLILTQHFFFIKYCFSKRQGKGAGDFTHLHPIIIAALPVRWQTGNMGFLWALYIWPQHGAPLQQPGH